MNLYIKNNTFWFELENLTRLFFPDEKINVFKSFDSVEKPYIYTELSNVITVRVEVGEFKKEAVSHLPESNEDNELVTAQLLYKILSELCETKQPWGLLTGVRPIKLFRKLKDQLGEDKAAERFSREYFVSDEKLSLARETEKNERRIIELSTPESFSLYVGIPFCPSRCSYCSFVMTSVEQTKKLTEPYTELLCEELKVTADTAAKLGLRLETVYFGGGTPTTLSAEQLDRLLGTVNSCFDMKACREFTVEAGRPDTVDRARLSALRENGVSRISINPQTINDDVLKKIGRRHDSESFFSAFKLAREMGFDNINTDLIAGLPSDTPESFAESLDAMLNLDAECITVHTLSLKRASTLNLNGEIPDRQSAEYARSMLSYAQSRLTDSGYIPYYLYRQTRMTGNLENTGWSKRGYESLYNVYVMDETHTVLACGSTGVTKLKDSSSDYLKRVFNFKYPYEYINRFDEIIQRKSEITDFYGK